MKRFSCIIFDLDGTLTQTNELIFATFNHVTERYLGKSFTPAEITGMFGPPEEVAIERLIPSPHVQSATEEFFRFYTENHLAMARAYSGIEEILRYLHEQQTLIALFTGKGRRSTDITLSAIGMKHYFDTIVTGTDVTNFKPSGEGIAKVLDLFKLQPSEVLMVGDAVNDIKAARSTGVEVAAVVWDSYGKTAVLEMNADYVFHTVEEFFAWIKNVVSNNTAAGI